MGKLSFLSGKKGRGGFTSQHRKSVPTMITSVVDDADIILEVLDARFIEETRNEEVEKMIRNKGKSLIYVLNKVDLVDLNEAKEKIELLGLHPVIYFSAVSRRGVIDLRNKIKIEAKKFDFNIKRVGVVGYPNAGKSSIINILVGKGVARTSPVAGFTKAIQKLRLSKGIVLLDTPGIIPIEEAAGMGFHLKKHMQIGARTWSNAENPEASVYEIIKKYPGVLQKYYKIETESSDELIEKVGRSKNFLVKGGRVDEDRASRQILRDWQEGKIKQEE